MKSPGHYWNEMRDAREEAFRTTDIDGPILLIFKRIFGRKIWHRPIELFTLQYLRDSHAIDVLENDEVAKALFNKGVEYYWLLWTGLVCAVYVLAFLVGQAGPFAANTGYVRYLRAASLLILGVAACYRVVEILATSFRLHLLELYKTDAPAHAVVLTFLAYGHMLVSFGVLYIAEAFFLCDCYSASQPIWACWFSAAYFSAVTITTLGYGDFSPKYWPGQILVVFEVFIGLILIIVAFQRVLAGVVCEKQGEGATQPPDSQGDAPN
jgi:voltage-gated potassium channel Kch